MDVFSERSHRQDSRRICIETGSFRFVCSRGLGIHTAIDSSGKDDFLLHGDRRIGRLSNPRCSLVGPNLQILQLAKVNVEDLLNPCYVTFW